MTKELVFQSKDGKVYKKINGGDSDDSKYRTTKK